MSNGKTHAATTKSQLIAGTALAAIGWFLAPIAVVRWAVVGLAIGLAAGHLITPDLDQRKITFEERRMIRWFGPLGWLWRAYWQPYGILMAHRGWSHTVPQGTLTRMAYLLIPLAALGAVAAQMADLRLDARLLPYILLASCTCTAGWMLQDLIHLWLDHQFPQHAPWRRPSWQPQDD